jgi:hypothetical protein
MSRIDPLPMGTVAGLEPSFERYRKALGFVPNSALILQRKPEILKALASLSAAIWAPDSEVTVPFKRLIAYMASKAHGCNY